MVFGVGSRWFILIAAVLVAGLAFAARVEFGGEPGQVGGWVRVSDPDATYHLRRAERMGEGFPTLAIADPFLNAPEGAVVPWPPLWDLALAGASAISPADPATGFVRPWIAALPPLVAALAVLAVFALARRLFPGRLDLTLAAAAAAALVAADRPWTGFGRLDHSAAELLAWCAFAAVLARALDRPPETGGAVDRRALVPAAILALGLATQAALLPAAGLPMVAYLVLPTQRFGEAPRFLATLWGACALLLLPFSLAYAAAGAPLAHTHFGLFQPALLGSAALVAVGWAARGKKRLGRRTVAVGAAVAGAVGLVALAPELARGLGFIGRTSEWIASIGESRSPFAGSAGAGLGFFWRETSPLVALVPVGLVAFVRRARKGDGAAAAAAAALLGGTLLAASQARFAGHLGLLAGVGAAAALSFFPTQLFRSTAVRVATAALLVAAAALPQLPLLRRPRLPEASERALADSFDVLAALRERAAHEPEEGRGPVLAEWSFGHFVQWYGRHPAAVDNFGDFLGDLSLPRRALLAEDEAEAEAVLAEREVRYLLVGELAETLSGLLATDAQRARYVAGGGFGTGGFAVEFRPPIVRTVLYRAARQLGTAVASPEEGLQPPLRTLRLIAESAATDTLPDGRRIARYKLYERVAGARLRVAGLPPGSQASLEGEIRSPGGVVFPWLDLATADPSGAVEFRFPYSSEATAGARPLAPAVRAGERLLPVRAIPERAVVAGRAVEVG